MPVKKEFSITIHMVSSLDGMIAKNDNDLAWFETSSPFPQGIEAENTEQFLAAIDCYVMGAYTYELALKLSESYGWPYGNKPVVVLTTRNLLSKNENITFFAGDNADLVETYLKPRYNNVWLVGGANVIGDFIRQKLATEMRISVLPILLGDGIRLFEKLEVEQILHLKDVLPYKNGMVEMWYMFKY